MPGKLLLIHPVNQLRKGFVNHESTSFMPLGLGIVAALTPPDWEVELIDDSFGEFSYKPADLVAFTGFTANAPRAYEIAAIYREKGIHTVMGGVHATMCTDEVAIYMDTVFTGEAEGAWPALISDFEAGRIKKRYDGGIVDIHDIGIARRDIFKKYPYHYDSVQTSRGCPQGCDFCSVTQMCGKTYREREVEDILDELEKTTHPLIFFVDDNLVNQKKGAEERAIRLFKGIVERGIKKYWFSQAALNFADNDEVLHWARKSGCMMVLMGIEAENPNALKDVRKNFNLKRGVKSYDETFRRIHKHGISVLAAMIFGMESDTKADLYARRDFIRDSSCDSYQCSILTPLPGTALYHRLKEQNKIVLNNYPDDWQQYDNMMAIVNTSNLGREELDMVMRDIWYSLYNKKAMRKKMFRTLWNTKSFKTAYWAYASNHNYGRMLLERFFQTDPEGINEKFEWKKKKKSYYLKFTSIIIWMIYQLSWGKTVNRMSGRNGRPNG
jgi:radical SAM superfamily enzyme YgiQ (UPF0313 family)